MKRILCIAVCLLLPYAGRTQTPASDDAVSLRSQIDALQKQVSDLREENQLLRRLLSSKLSVEQAKPSTTTPTIVPAVQPAISATPSAQQPVAQPLTVKQSTTTTTNETGFWLSSTGKRHNKNCRYYQNCKGRPCGADDGVPCKICGG